MKLDTQTCVVTGSSRGIGEGIATELAAHGANVVVNYRSSEREAYDVVDEIEADGGTAIAVQADVTDEDEVDAMVDRVKNAFGPTDVLVNNAGITVDKKFEQMTREDWDQVVDVNLGGVYNCTNAFFDDLKDAEHGRLINISSVVASKATTVRPTTRPPKAGCLGLPEPSRLNSPIRGRPPTASRPASSRLICWIKSPNVSKTRSSSGFPSTALPRSTMWLASSGFWQPRTPTT